MKNIFLLVLLVSGKISAQTPLDGEFTYQGSLQFNSIPANGEYDFTFKLFDNIPPGNQIGTDIVVEDIIVVDGLFTTILDFDTTSFMGDKVWLDISIREGNSTGSFQQLLPRQQITSAPYAIHAQFVGVDAVTSSEIQDGSITNADLTNDSITSNKIVDGSITSSDISGNSITTIAILDSAVSNSKIANNAVTKDKMDINSVGTTEIISSQVQRRITSSCATGSYINAVNEDGTVICETDDSGNASNITSADIVDGTIATVDLANQSVTSTKIADGTITISDIANNAIDSLNIVDDSLTSLDIQNGTVSTIDLANNSVTFDKIADGSVGAGKVSSNEVQLRISDTCAAGDFVTSVNEDGTLNCNGIGAINGADITAGTITSTQLANGSVNSDKIDNNSIFNQHLADNIITTAKISNGSVDTDDIATGAVTSVKIQNNSISSNDIIVSEIQTRVSGTCPADSFITSVNEDGSVNCAIDDTGFSNITTTEIVNGTILNEDIANDTITASKIAANTLSANEIGTNAVNSDEINADSVGASEIISSQVQRRINSSCNIGFYLRGINEDGTVLCEGLPEVLDFPLDSSANVGDYSSIALGSDDNPIISYFDYTNGNLKAIKCTTNNCRTFNSPVTLDSTGTVGWYTSIAIGTDNNPIISYYDVTNSALKVVKCTTTSCSSFNTPVVLDSTGSVGLFSSIAIGSDSNPIISYYDATNKDLKAVKCTTASCSSFNTPVLLDSGGDVGDNTSIAIGTDNNPIISYHDTTNEDLKIVKCTTIDCISFNTPVTIAITGIVGRSSRILINSGYPIIVYDDFTNDSMNFTTCTTQDCTILTPEIVIDTNVAIGSLDMTLDSLQLPVISYFANQHLKVVKCASVFCSSFNTPITLKYNTGSSPSIVVNSANNPIISYGEFQFNDSLNVYSCIDPACRR